MRKAFDRLYKHLLASILLNAAISCLYFPSLIRGRVERLNRDRGLREVLLPSIGSRYCLLRLRFRGYNIEVWWYSLDDFVAKLVEIGTEELPPKHAHLLHLGNGIFELGKSPLLVNLLALIGAGIVTEYFVEISDEAAECTLEGRIGVQVGKL